MPTHPGFSGLGRLWSAPLPLSVVVVSHLLLLWLWVQSSPNLRVRADRSDHLHKTIVYLPLDPQGEVKSRRAEQKSRQLTKEAVPYQQNEQSAGSFERIQVKVDATSSAESVGASSQLAAPAAAGSTSPGVAQRHWFDNPIVMGQQLHQLSLSEVANQQINPEGPPDRLKRGIQDAALPVCLASNEAGGILSPIAIAFAALRGKCKLP